MKGSKANITTTPTRNTILSPGPTDVRENRVLPACPVNQLPPLVCAFSRRARQTSVAAKCPSCALLPSTREVACTGECSMRLLRLLSSLTSACVSNQFLASYSFLHNLTLVSSL
jgi:hypothetical protein